MTVAVPQATTAADGRTRWLALPAGVSAAILIVASAVVPFLTPLWIFPGQDRAHADAWTGWSSDTVHAVTASVLRDLIVGPPDFAQTAPPDDTPVFTAREASHLRDVRSAFLGFALVALVAAVVLVATTIAGRGSHAVARGIRTGAAVLAVGVVALGVLSVVAFDTVFEIFHELLFPAGSYTFDPATDRLVQLFPEAFWYETAIALGVVIVVASTIVAWLAGRRLRGTPA